MVDEVSPLVVTAAKKSYFSISEFRSEMKKNDTIANHSYLVVFSPFNSRSTSTKELSKILTLDSDTIVMRCDAAQLPGAKLITEDNIRRYGYGPIETTAKGVQFSDITLTWIVDKNAKIVNFFNTWMNIIVDHNSEGGKSMNNETERGEILFSPYEVGYKDDYSNPMMSIFVYDRSQRTIMTYKVYDVFPKFIQDNMVSWSDTDSVMRYSVTFAMTDCKISTKQDPEEFSKSLVSRPYVAKPYAEMIRNLK